MRREKQVLRFAQDDTRETIAGNQISYAFPVRQNQEFAVGVGLGQKAPDRLREPLPPIAGQAEAGD